MKPSSELADVPFDDVVADTNVNGVYARPTRPTARILPHSLEAEEYLLSCCMIEGGNVVSRCLEARISPHSFYDTKHGLVFGKILALFERKTPIDVSIIAEELKRTNELDGVGGYAFLLQVSGRVPTTAQAGYFIETVSAHHTRREIIRAAMVAIEEAHDTALPIEDLAQSTKRRLEQATKKQIRSGQRMEWDDLLGFDPKQDPDCLMGNRFLGRTGAAVIVAPSGVGKSVLALQLGACAALGRPFFGMVMRQAMRVLYLQAEDDFGDVAESAQGFIRGMGIEDADRAVIKERLRIERWNDVSGDRFLARLRQQYAIWPYDLVVMNPLFSFCGCNVSEQRELSPFLRNGLNSVLNDTRAAGIVVHHTNKPPADPTAQDKAMDAELRYLGSGSAELTNWARAYITLQGVRSAGDHVHKMVFVKRGGRTGICDPEGKPTHQVMIEHSKTGLCWLASDYRNESKGQFLAKFDLSRALGIYDPKKHWAENEILIARALELNPRTVRRHRQVIEENG
jgi:hypothetical protein